MDESDESYNTSISMSTTNMSNDSVDDNENLVIMLGLPFEINNNKKINHKANYFYNILLDLQWEKTDTCEDYLQKIKAESCKYFNINNYHEIALNMIITKQILDIRINIKEHINRLLTGNLNRQKSKIHLLKMVKTHKIQIDSLNRAFTQKDINPHISHSEQYYRYVMKLLDHKSPNVDKHQVTKYSIKIEIELESELHHRNLIKYEWQCQMYDELVTYYEHN
jgi:hypothetical protein